MRIHFLGAADTVTGSKHLIELRDGNRILLDCGLFQGFKLFRERNWAPLPNDARSIDAVVLSHAHLDHSGWLPVLVKSGFKGPVIATAATRALCEVLLLDAAHLQEEDARRANRHHYSRHAPALPLFTRADVQRTMSRFQVLEPGRDHRQGSASVRFTPVGHLLGACAVTLAQGGAALAFSGDLGRPDDLLMPPPQTLERADVMIVESTYGNRLHPPSNAQATLGQIVRDTVQRGGSVLLPSFAVGRAQALLLLLQRLRAAGEIPLRLPIFIDSPMAVQATALYLRHKRLLRVPAAQVQSLCDGVRLVTTVAQSMRLVGSRMPRIVISASGMATGGRVLHHLKAMAPDARHHIVLAGFQVGGSRGAHLLAGAPEVKIHGEYVPVRAQVSALQGVSGHADANQLLDWLRALRKPPAQTFVVHGEPDAADMLRHRIQDELHWRARVPQQGEVVDV
ncbi:MAG TPA: MBL fold metallo-hydrolase [Burkholderiaceae bacterium]|nr:MBL fold metallo-hydrolase [Burkholderiaceae bacterium]